MTHLLQGNLQDQCIYLSFDYTRIESLLNTYFIKTVYNYRHMQRKIRRETMSGEQRLDKFLQQNGLILTAFSGGVVISQIAS